MASRLVGHRRYELKDHLGNVRVVLSDQKRLFKLDYLSDTTLSLQLRASVLSYNNYYPFGLEQPEATLNSEVYRFGFNGKENDREWGTGGLTQDYGFRLYNPGIAKFLSVDPITEEYPELTPYQFASNTPISAIDLDGLEALDFRLRGENGQDLGASLTGSRGFGVITYSSTTGGAPIGLWNSALRLNYAYRASQLKPLYSARFQTPSHIRGVDLRTRYLDVTRNWMIGGRVHLDKAKPVSPRYFSNTFYVEQKYYRIERIRENNPRFFKTSWKVNAFGTIGFIGSVYALNDTRLNLQEAAQEGRLAEQSFIEGSKWGGAYLGTKMGVNVAAYGPIPLTRTPLGALLTVGAFTALGSIVGEEGMEAIQEHWTNRPGDDPTIEDQTKKGLHMSRDANQKMLEQRLKIVGQDQKQDEK